jgi:hypothetical protein
MIDKGTDGEVNPGFGIRRTDRSYLPGTAVARGIVVVACGEMLHLYCRSHPYIGAYCGVLCGLVIAQLLRPRLSARHIGYLALAALIATGLWHAIGSP